MKSLKCLSFFLFNILLFFSSCNSEKEDKQYLSFAMSHNDYQQDMPLITAVDNGFACVEADIFLKEGVLYVAHLEGEITPTRTLENMYLDPIRRFVAEGKYSVEKPLLLYIDLKTKGETFKVLCDHLQKYKDILAYYDLDGYHPGKVKVITGNWSMMEKMETRYAFAETNSKLLNDELPATSVVLINNRWRDYFSWQGIGEMPIKEELLLRKMVAEAKQKERILRFWETDFETNEQRERLWSKLYACGVQLISTDYIEDFASYFKDRESNERENDLIKPVVQEKNGYCVEALGKVRLGSGSLSDSETSITKEITDNGVCVFRMDHPGGQDTLIYKFKSTGDLEEGVASYLFGDWESWTKPVLFSHVEELPEEKIMFSLWRHKDGVYGCMIPLCGGDWVSHLAGGNSGLGAISINWKENGAKEVPLMAIGFDENPYSLVKKVYAEGMRIIGRNNNLRKYKTYPEIFENIGWCTWNAMYEQVSEDKIVNGVKSFNNLGVKIPWLLIDDGWLTIDNQKRLTSLDFDRNKFPKGISSVVQNLSTNYGVKHVGVWHTMNGYWSGLTGKLVRDKNEIITPYRDKANVHEKQWDDVIYNAPDPSVDSDDSFYDEWYGQLMRQGISFVKVDQQSVIKRLAYGIQKGNLNSYWQVATGIERALQRSAQKYFDGRIVNCQDMAIEALYNMSSSAIIRNSDDFFPERTAYYSLEVEKGNAAAHAIMNIHNALWTSQLAWPDYDMFQSHHVDATYHAALRAISGGPIYLTDTPGEQNEGVIKKLIDHKGRIYRVDQPALPTADCLFSINDGEPLKSYSIIGNAGVLGIWNADDANEVKGTWSVGDIPDLDSEQYVAFESQSQRLINISKEDDVPVVLKRMQFEYWNLVPMKNECAFIGLLNKYNSRVAVKAEVFRDNQIYAVISEGGEIGVRLPRKPLELLVDNKPIEGDWDSSSHLLKINYESKQEVIVSIKL